MPRSMIPTSQKPAAVQKIDAAVEKAKTRVFWGGWCLVAGGSAVAFVSYMLAGPQALMDSASKQVKIDPFVARKLGVPLKTYGQGCECSRLGRSTVYVEEFRDSQLRPVARTTFYVEGPKGKGVVDARVLNQGIEHAFLRRAARMPVFTSLEVIHASMQRVFLSIEYVV